MKKELVLKKLLTQQVLSMNILEKYIDDEDVMKLVLKNSPNFLKNVSKRLKNSEDVVKIATNVWGNSIMYASKRIRNSKDFITKNVSLSNIGFALTSLGKSIFEDEDFVVDLIEKNLSVITDYLPKSVKRNPNIYRRLIKSNNLNKINFKIENNIYQEKDIVTELAKIDGAYLEKAPLDLKSDRELLRKIIIKKSSNIQFASRKLKDDKELALLAVGLNGNSLQFISTRLKNDIDIVSCAIEKNGEALQYVPKKFLNNRDLIEKSFKFHYELNLDKININKEFKNCRNFVLKALTNRVSIYATISQDLKRDKELALLALDISGLNYNYMDISIKEDLDIIKKLINISPRMITIDLLLKENKNYIMMALNENPAFYRYIKNSFQKDDDILSIALKNGKRILLDVNLLNFQDTDFLTKLLQKLEINNNLFEPTLLMVKKVLKNKYYKELFNKNFKENDKYNRNILIELLDLKMKKELLMVLTPNNSLNKKLKF